MSDFPGALSVVPLGRSGIEITEFVYGSGSIGGVGSAVATRGLGIDAEQGLERLSEAYGLGIRMIDTADAYGGGESERTVGHWLATHDARDVIVQTKVGNIVRPDQTGVDLSGPHIAHQLAQSIARLGRVDLYLAHATDPDTPIEETLTAFATALEASQIRAYGLSNVDVLRLESWLEAASRAGLPRPEFVQNSFSLLNRADEPSLLPFLRAEGIGFLAFSPLAGGVLSDRYLDGSAPSPRSRIAVAGDRYYAGMHSPANLERVAGLRDLARAQGTSTAGLALGWLRHHPMVTAPIVAPSTKNQWQAVSDALSVSDVPAAVGDIFR